MPTSTIKSFHSLSVENPGFAVHPRFWTANHLSIINSRFQQIETDDGHGLRTLDIQTAQRLAESAKKLAVGSIAGTKYLWVENLLLRKGKSPIALSNAHLSFYYAQRRDRLIDSRVHTFRIKDEISIPHADPMIGYYRYSADEERRQMLRAPRPPRGLKNSPVQRKYDARRRKMTPADWRHDPYLVCILLSLAQLQQRKVYGPRALFLARLLVTNMADQTDSYVYKADVPYQLLESLDCPTRSIGDFDFPLVKYVKIPFEPYSTFSERVQVHLAGAEYSPRSSPVGSTLMGPSSPRGKKRKRDEE